MALFSIVIPVLNAAHSLPQTLRAIQAQTWNRWEALIVDCGSTDATLSVALSLAATDPRIQVMVNPGKGAISARNFAALRRARGDILSFCEAGDLWTPHKLEDVALSLFGEGADAAFGRVAFYSEDPKAPRSHSTVPRGPLCISMLLADNPVCTLSNFSVGRAWFAQLGGFDDRLVQNEDLDFLIRLVGEGGWIDGIQRDHVLYRSGRSGPSSDPESARADRRQVISNALRFGNAPDTRIETHAPRGSAPRNSAPIAPRPTPSPTHLRSVLRDGTEGGLWRRQAARLRSLGSALAARLHRLPLHALFGGQTSH